MQKSVCILSVLQLACHTLKIGACTMSMGVDYQQKFLQQLAVLILSVLHACIYVAVAHGAGASMQGLGLVLYLFWWDCSVTLPHLIS
jgi:hypothetical protein